MKKRLCAVLLLLHLLSSVYSQHLNDPEKDSQYFEAEILIREDLKGNRLKLQNLSGELTLNQKRSLIMENKIDYKVPMLVNFFAPFAIGSFVQGDTLGGVIGATGDLASTTLFAIGIVSIYENGFEESLNYIVAGGIVSAVNLIFKLVKPVTYAKVNNSYLYEALPMNSETSYSLQLIPQVNVTAAGELTPALGFKFTF